MIKIETNLEIVEIPDLKLFVKKHDPVWITKEQYKSSLALKHLEKMGSVICYPNQRSREVSKLPKPKKAPIRTAKLSRPNKGGLGNKSVKEPDIQETIRQATQEAATQAAEKAVQAVTSHLLGNLPQNQKSPLQPNVEGLEEMIQRAVANALGNTQVTTSNKDSSNPVVLEEPVYIPSNIVDKDAKGSVNIKSETSTSDGVEDASEALKKLRKTKSRKGKK